MKIAVLGTGMVGKAHAARLSELGHTVAMGTRDIAATASSDKPDEGGQRFADWHKQHEEVQLTTFAEAIAPSEIIINALLGSVSLEVLKGLEAELTGKVLIDLSNALDLSKGMPPSLLVCNTDSIGEQIQRALPSVKVVKTCNTTYASIQVNPSGFADGDHHMFVSGNDKQAKAKVTELLKSYGWKNILDLGDITTARGTEAYMLLYFALASAPGGNFMLNIKVVEA